MGKRLTALAVTLALAAGLCPNVAFAAPSLTAGSATGQDTALATQSGPATQVGLVAQSGPASQASLAAQPSLAAQATKAAKATKLAKKAIKLMNALPKASKVKLAHAENTATAFDAVVAAAKDWSAFEKTGASIRKAFLKAFNKKFVPACYALEKQVKKATAKAKKAQVKNVKVAPGNGSATVSWGKLGSSYSYEVYCSAKKSSGYKKAESTRGAKLTVENLAGDKTYYFKVRAYRADIPATALIGDMGKIAYGKYSSPVAAEIAPGIQAASVANQCSSPVAAKPAPGTQAASAANQGPASPAATGTALGAQAARSLSQPDVQDAFDSCRVYLRDIKGKSKSGYATGTLKGDLNKMKDMVDSLNAYADKQKVDRAKKAYDAVNKITPPSNGETQAVWQSGTGQTSVTVKWGVPAIARRDDVTMLHWRVSWRKLGDVGWSSPKTVAYSGSSSSSRECTVTGLSQGKTYEVRVGYRYQVGNEQGTYVTVDDWRSCTATTIMKLTFSSPSFGYHYSASNSGASIDVSVAGPPSFSSNRSEFYYQWYINPGVNFNEAKANRFYESHLGLSSGNNRLMWYSYNDSKLYGLTRGYAVSTVGVRTVARYYDAGIEIKSGWSTKQVVADPQFRIGGEIVSNYTVTGFVVGIPPLTGAKSYTVYLGKRKGSDSNEVTGWKVAGTYAANDGKTTKAIVDNYGGKKIAKYRNFSSQEWAVKVVTNTLSGSSPGDYWRSYNHGDLIPHEGLVY